MAHCTARSTLYQGGKHTEQPGECGRNPEEEAGIQVQMIKASAQLRLRRSTSGEVQLLGML